MKTKYKEVTTIDNARASVVVNKLERESKLKKRVYTTWEQAKINKHIRENCYNPYQTSGGIVW